MSNKLNKMGNQELLAIWTSLTDDEKIVWDGIVLDRGIVDDRRKRNELVVQVFNEINKRGIESLLR